MHRPGYHDRPRTEMLAFVPQQARHILDVGCGGGVFAAGLKAVHSTPDRPCEVWGIELSPAAAERAATRLDRVLTGDAVELLAALPEGHFDCIVANDLLEHLVDPERLLSGLATKLAPEGRLVVSLPNVRYFFNLWDLVVRGRWDYVDDGILDRTHLRFFTRSSIVDLLTRCGYRDIQMRGINPTGSLKFKLFHALSLGRAADMQYLQFACSASHGDPDSTEKGVA